MIHLILFLFVFSVCQVEASEEKNQFVDPTAAPAAVEIGELERKDKSSSLTGNTSCCQGQGSICAKVKDKHHHRPEALNLLIAGAHQRGADSTSADIAELDRAIDTIGVNSRLYRIHRVGMKLYAARKEGHDVDTQLEKFHNEVNRRVKKLFKNNKAKANAFIEQALPSLTYEPGDRPPVLPFRVNYRKKTSVFETDD